MRCTNDGKKRNRWLLRRIAMLAIAGLGIGWLTPDQATGDDTVTASVEFYDVRAQTREFLAYNRSISLTQGQRAVMHEALSSLRAPCCSDRTAATCCCPCNMAKAWWGLSKHLITERDYGVGQVREAVADWIEFINPKGFTGKACYSGGCGRAFHEDGCGGMEAKRLKF